MKNLFIADLHLDPQRPDIESCFEQFIHSCLNSVQEINALYILGDLFEFWIGDDASLAVYQQPIAQLKLLSDSGISLFVMHGNRDFLLGSEFEQASGSQLIPDLFHLDDTCLLSHGDIFCTDDTDYMAFRKMVRNPDWQAEFLSQTISERVKIARNIRQQSRQRSQEKAAEITDVNQHSVAQIMSEHQCDTLIHGHTHRPAVHEFMLNQQSARRIVLPDWNPGADAFELKTNS